MKKEKVTYEQFNKQLGKKIKPLVEWFEKTESPADACKDFIYQLVTELGYSHFITVGMLTEVLLEWRNVSNEVLGEELEEEKVEGKKNLSAAG